MATKKKSKKQTKSKSAGGKKAKPKKKAPQKSLGNKKVFPKKSAVKTKSSARKISARKSARSIKKRIRGQSQNVGGVEFTPSGIGARSGGQSGSLQGLSNKAAADSESVDELIEEGNAFEAEVVKGVEDAPDPDEEEVHTHEVPEDDVPGEYDEQ